MKKFCTITLYILLCVSFLFGCGEPERDPGSSVKAIYDLYILGDTKGVSALGMSEEDITAAQTAYDDSVRETIRANFSASGQTIDDTTLDNLCSARREALSKLSATTKLTAESEGRATIVLYTTYFDEAALDKDAFYQAKSSATLHSYLSDIEKQRAYLMECYTENLINAYKNVTPSTDTNSVTVECVIQDNEWVPANMSSFGADLALATTGTQEE